MIQKLIEEVGELEAEIKRKITDKQLLKMELVDVVYVLNQVIFKFGYSYEELLRDGIKKNEKKRIV